METTQLSINDQLSADVQASFKLLHNFVNVALGAGLVRSIEDTEPILTALRTLKKHIDGSGSTAKPENTRTNRKRSGKDRPDITPTGAVDNGPQKENTGTLPAGTTGANGSAATSGASKSRNGSAGGKKSNREIKSPAPVIEPAPDDLPFSQDAVQHD